MGDRYPSDWGSRRKKVYKRDNYRCQRCGARGGSRGNSELHAHHKTPISEGGSHRYGNLKTVCKSCHKNIHGHGVGGSSSNSSTKPGGGEEVDPVIMALSILLVGVIVFLAITYGAVVQVLPAGGTVSEEYSVEYIGVTQNDQGHDVASDHHAGSPLALYYEVEDNVISEHQETTLTVLLHNPSDNHLRGELKVLGHTNHRLEGEIRNLGFDLQSGETALENITLTGENMVADSGSNRRTTKFDADVNLWNDDYLELTTNRKASSKNDLQLRVRKPFFDRFGFYWLSLLGLLLVGGGFGLWKKRGGSLDISLNR